MTNKSTGALLLSLALALTGNATADCIGGTVPPNWHAQSSAGPFVSPQYWSSRPTATYVLYIDFDGALIATSATHDWNCGNTFNLNHSGLTLEKMREIYEVVKEDYLPFNVNVTTDENHYIGASSFRRMRCIVTPSDAWLWTSESIDPKGGIAKVDSFGRTGAGQYAADMPCFAWINSFDAAGRAANDSKDLGTIVSHEFGHTLGLTHDGETGDDDGYFLGLGPKAGGKPRLWSPVMGFGSGLLTQWNNGEYAGYASRQVSPDPANINPKDDVAIIANIGSGGNNFGFAPDDHGSTQATASPVSPNGGLVANGVIGRLPGGAEDEDWFTFTLADTRMLSLLVAPAEPFTDSDPLVRFRRNVGIANLNPRVDLYRQSTSLSHLAGVSGSNDVALPEGYTATEEMTKISEALRVRINQTLIPGTYFLKITGVGFGNPATNGYSSYGSMGAYSIDGTLLTPLTVTSAGSAGGTVAMPFTPFQLTASGPVTSWSATGLPPGLTVGTFSGLITGVPTTAGTFPVTITVNGNGGPGTRSMSFVITPGTALADATETTSFVWTIPTGYSGWFIQTATNHDTTDAAQSSDIGDSGAAAMETQVNGPGTISFWWKVESELNKDNVHFLVNGVEQPGGIWSGARAWAQKTYTLGAGLQTLRWVYDKDGSDSSGADAAWVDQIVWTGTTPLITSATTATTNVGQAFSYFITSSINPANFGALLPLPAGLNFNSSTGEISGRLQAAGTYGITITANTPGGFAINQLNITANATPLVTATEAPLDWTTSGNGGNVWFSQTAETQDGVDALRSGAIGNGQSSFLQASVTGPGTLNFWWKVDCESDVDLLVFKIDGVQQSVISGSRGWAERSVGIGAGSHFVSWTYQKDSANAAGADAGWLDHVTWAPTPQVPVINSGSAITTTVGTSLFFQVSATGAPVSFAISSGTAPTGSTFNVLGPGIFSGTPDRPGSFPLQVTATNTAGTSVPASLMITVRSSFENWAAAYGLSGSNALPTADPDRDGRSNFMEMALAQRPDFVEPAFVPVGFDPATKRLRATFTRIQAYRDVTYEVQVSDNPSTWTTIARSTNGDPTVSLGAFSVSDPGGASPTVTVVDNAIWPTKTKRSMRIKITQL